MSTHGTDAGAFSPQVVLHSSRLYAGMLCLLAVAAAIAAAVSNLPLTVKALLLPATLLTLLYAWQSESRRGLRGIHAGHPDESLLALQFADGKKSEGRYAGYAVLGSVAVFLYVERAGWRRVFGPQRIAILRDATDADAFRRLRAWARLNASRAPARNPPLPAASADNPVCSAGRDSPCASTRNG